MRNVFSGPLMIVFGLSMVVLYGSDEGLYADCESMVMANVACVLLVVMAVLTITLAAMWATACLRWVRCANERRQYEYTGTDPGAAAEYRALVVTVYNRNGSK